MTAPDTLEQWKNASIGAIFDHNKKQSKKGGKRVRCTVEDYVTPLQYDRNFNQHCKKHKENVYVKPKSQSTAKVKRAKLVLKPKIEYQVLSDDKTWISQTRWNTRCYNTWTIDDISEFNNSQPNDSTTIVQCPVCDGFIENKIIYINSNSGTTTNSIDNVTISSAEYHQLKAKYWLDEYKLKSVLFVYQRPSNIQMKL